MVEAKITGEVIGIDLGTTFSCVAVARKGRSVEIIANDQGNRTTPSAVAFSPAAAGFERLLGEAAKNQATLNPRRTIFDVKRLIGKKFHDPEVQNDLKYLPYPVVERDGRPCVEVEVNGEQKKTFTPEEISAMVLGKMKETAEAYLGKQVTNAVVSVPAYFNDLQRQATKDAGIIAGLNVLRIINEPTAGALAYGVNQDPNTKRNILVYDLGGGTFDVSVLEIEDGIFQVLATGGDTHLGGGDFDQRLMEYFVDLIKKRYRKDVSEDGKALGKLRRQCERAKRVLSSQMQTRVEIDSLIQGIDFSEPLTRAKFEDLNLDLFERTLEVVKSTLKDAKVEKDKIDEIVLVGGSTRIPKVREMLKKMFDGKEPSKGINPDEAVAYGAAVLGGNLTSDRAGVGNFANLSKPYQLVYQGERTLTKDCLLLGSFTLTGIQAAPSGAVRMEVTFEVDADGILTVTAKEEATGNSRSLTIDNYKKNLSSREIERMIREAREMAEHDKKERERVEAGNQMEQDIYDLNKAIAEKLHMYGGDKTTVERASREASDWFDNNNSASMQEYKDRSTTFSCVAVARKGRAVEIIANEQGNRTTPSYVAFSPAAAGSERLIGEAAKNQATLNPRGTIFDVKRLIGKKFDDLEVQSDLNYLPYPIVERDGKPCVQVEVNGELKTFTPEEISAMVLGRMKETAELYLGKQVTNAVVTVPAYFNDSQRQATKDAGTIAGLNVVRIINEPTAGALAYGVNQDSKRKRTILVFDLGGGTFDVSVLNIDKGEFRVLATGGDTHLGGGDFDQRVMKYFVDLIKRKYNKDVTQDPKAIGKLRRECERAKRVLSSQTQTRVEIDCFIDGMDFFEPLSRVRFEDLNSDMFEKTMEVVRSTLKDAKVENKEQIDEIVLVGGSTRIPMVREMLKKEFDGKEPSEGINPDEAVAYGAAVQGAMLSTDQDELGLVLYDVTPLSLGINSYGGVMSVVVPRNTVIPAKRSSGRRITVGDQQTSFNVEVYQGERPLVKDCLWLGRFSLDGIAAAPRGVAAMKVTMEVDADGILSVTAKDVASENNSKSIAIKGYKRKLSEVEVERMVRDAKEMAEHDKMAKARVDSRNRLERYIYDLKKDVAEKVSMNDRVLVETALTEASRWLDDNENACMQDYEDKNRELKELWESYFVKNETD
ncbi:unnamed protein product [Linum tenue]|uniref:Heat shock protein 70 n=1 Tax=Linum tenue TaxID=586396 RepID=A0AAV0N738_9ROSI|nr:unnamed protein product [Linum tenue]